MNEKSVLELRSVNSISYPAKGGTKSLQVISQRVKYINGREVSREVVDVSLRGMESWSSYSKRQTSDGYIIDITLEENQGGYRGFDPEITQENGKSLTFSIGQAKATYRDEYFLDLSPNLMTWNYDESGYDWLQTCDITSRLDHYRNGRVVSSEKIPVSIRSTGDIGSFNWNYDKSSNTIEVYCYNDNNLNRELYAQLLVSQQDSLGEKDYTLDLYQYVAY